MWGQRCSERSPAQAETQAPCHLPGPSRLATSHVDWVSDTFQNLIPTIQMGKPRLGEAK